MLIPNNLHYISALLVSGINIVTVCILITALFLMVIGEGKPSTIYNWYLALFLAIAVIIIAFVIHFTFQGIIS